MKFCRNRMLKAQKCKTRVRSQEVKVFSRMANSIQQSKLLRTLAALLPCADQLCGRDLPLPHLQVQPQQSKEPE